MSEAGKSNHEEKELSGKGKRVEGQATLSAIGDVSIAATAAVGQSAAPPGETRWLPITGFLLLVYFAGSVAAIYAHRSPAWAQVFAAPLLVVLIATLAFWRRQVWKFRTRDSKYRVRAQQDRLNSFAHETANGLNAIRANLAGFCQAASSPSAAEHRQQVEQALARIEAALTMAIGVTPAKPASGSKASAEARQQRAA